VLRYCDFDYVGHFVSILMCLVKQIRSKPELEVVALTFVDVLRTLLMLRDAVADRSEPFRPRYDLQISQPRYSDSHAG
jgi:hypothetical protein